MQLDLKTREYKKMCEQLDELKKDNITLNDERLLKLREKFLENQQKIVQIKNQLKETQENEQAQYGMDSLLKDVSKDNVNLMKVENNISVEKKR